MSGHTGAGAGITGNENERFFRLSVNLINPIRYIELTGIACCDSFYRVLKEGRRIYFFITCMLREVDIVGTTSNEQSV
ncbi:hypothetical protein XYCOK13_00270 [Xylanibacillus composti]|uniref:Uncharacterized protein n=1 Tax=Xylanibacillus composti TaxID=1572762 RepID=A0A8J4H211_9BACL|nr:hypothetical protein XYCOK13_00270 [Xylanibacillus composti]